MKKMIMLGTALLTSFLVCASTLPVQAEASQADGEEQLYGFPSTISLVEETALYELPDEDTVSWAKLSPQDVKVVRTQYASEGSLQADGATWMEIHTDWLGDMWIHIDNHKIGTIQPLSLDLPLAADTPLYDGPFHESVNGAVLSPQTVHAKAEFRSPSGFYALQIETSWKGDQWLINPDLEDSLEDSAVVSPAISPDYGDLMAIRDLRLVHIGERTFVQGRYTIDREAWNVGRIHPGPEEHYVWGKLSLWNSSNEREALVSYALFNPAGAGQESLESPVLLPVDGNLSKIAAASLDDTFPFYFGLPVPPSFTITDPQGKVSVDLLNRHRSGDYTVANAWLLCKMPGDFNYYITLIFYDVNNKEIGQSFIYQRADRPLPTESTDSPDAGMMYRVQLVGKGAWGDYSRMEIRVETKAVE